MSVWPQEGLCPGQFDQPRLHVKNKNYTSHNSVCVPKLVCWQENHTDSFSDKHAANLIKLSRMIGGEKYLFMMNN